MTEREIPEEVKMTEGVVMTVEVEMTEGVVMTEEVEMTEGVVMTVEVEMTEGVVMTVLVEIGFAVNVATPTSHSEPNAIVAMPQNQAAEMEVVMSAVVDVMTIEAMNAEVKSAEAVEMTEADKTAPVEIGIAPSATTPTFHFEPNAIAAMLQEEEGIEETQEVEKEEAVAVSAVVNVVALIKSAMIEVTEATIEEVETIAEAIMTGPAHNAIIPTSHSEPNVTAVMHLRMEAVAREAAQEVLIEAAQEAVIEAAQEVVIEVVIEAAQEAVIEAAQGVANETADKEVRVEMDGEDLLSVAHQAGFSNHGNLEINLDTIVIERIQVIPLMATIEEGKFHG